MTPKEYKNKVMVKVVGSSYIEDTETVKKLMGKIYEVTAINYEEKVLIVNGYTFNLSDVQIATPVMYEGVNVCLQDKIQFEEYWYEVYDYIWYDGRYQLFVKNTQVEWKIDKSQIQALDPLYKEVKEELAVGSEVEITTKEGKIYQATINNIK